jgi:hypothetical protein
LDAPWPAARRRGGDLHVGVMPLSGDGDAQASSNAALAGLRNGGRRPVVARARARHAAPSIRSPRAHFAPLTASVTIEGMRWCRGVVFSLSKGQGQF